MISIVVGVNLVPTIITSINTAKTQANSVEGFSGLGGLMEVLAYVRKASLWSNLQMKTSQIRGKLNLFKHANPELSGEKSPKCVETRWLATHVVEGIVQAFTKVRGSCYIAVILLGAVAWIGSVLLYSNIQRIIPLIRGSLSRLWYGNPELAAFNRRQASVETLYGTSLIG